MSLKVFGLTNHTMQFTTGYVVNIGILAIGVYHIMSIFVIRVIKFLGIEITISKVT